MIALLSVSVKHFFKIRGKIFSAPFPQKKAPLRPQAERRKPLSFAPFYSFMNASNAVCSFANAFSAASSSFARTE